MHVPLVRDGSRSECEGFCLGSLLQSVAGWLGRSPKMYKNDMKLTSCTLLESQ